LEDKSQASIREETYTAERVTFSSGKNLTKFACDILESLFIKTICGRGWKKSDINSLCWLPFAEFGNLLQGKV
jgi:hypothetical protein